MKKDYLLGNHAISRGLIEGGMEAAFAYPGTPSSEIVQSLIDESPHNDYYVEWSINEKVAFENAYGVSLSGRRAAAVMKHVGLNVASDAFMTAAYTGIVGGFVILVADDPFAHSSQNEQDTRRYSAFSRIPCLEPASIQEAKDMAAFAFDFSERIGLPVLLRSVTRISHGKSEVIIGERPPARGKTYFVKDPGRFVMVPSNARIAIKELDKKQRLVECENEKMAFNKINKGSGKTGIIVSGISYQYVMEAMKVAGKNFPVFKAASYPLPKKKIESFLNGLDKVFVFEEGDPVIEEALYVIAGQAGIDIEIAGRMDGVVPVGGELSVDAVFDVIAKGEAGVVRAAAEKHRFPVRPPVLCPGCSHLGSFFILKKVFGKDAIFAGDIGCYTLGIQLGAIDTCLCMGGGISVGSGMSRIEEGREIISLIGDSTFFHSGVAGLINACYNKANQVIAVLDNRTTAMTGHQPHPGTGRTAAGLESPEIDIEKLAYICGVESVVTIDPYRIKESVELLKTIKGKKGVRVVISKRECVFVSRKTDIRYVVDETRCTGCKLCMNIRCPAISFAQEKASISLYCNGCGICAEVCPFNAIRSSDE